MEPVDPEPGGARLHRAGRVTSHQPELGESLRRLQQLRPVTLARLDSPLGRAILGQQLARIEVERLLECHRRPTVLSPQPRHSAGGQSLRELQQINLGIHLHGQPVGVAVPDQKRGSASNHTRFEHLPQGGDGHVQVAGAGFGIGLRPESFLEHLAMNQVASMDRQQPEHGTGAGLDGGQVDWPPLDRNAESAKAPHGQRGGLVDGSDLDHVLEGGGCENREGRQLALVQHGLRQRLVFSSAVRLDLGQRKIRKVPGSRRSAVAGEILRLQRRLSRVRRAGVSQPERE